MRAASTASAFAIAMLIVVSPIAGAPNASTSSPLPYQLVLFSGYYQFFQMDAPSSPTTISYSVLSNTTLSIALMTNAEATSFDNGATGVANSLHVQNSSSSQYSASVPEGVYYLVFFAYDFSANVTFNIQTFPVSPYIVYPLTSPEPSGVASFGLYNDSGVVKPYTVQSNDVLGVANIASLQADNASATFYNDTISGATLQLNSVLVVNEKGGSQQVYWTQNTPDFVTSVDQVSWADNIWNSSVSGLLSNSTITSNDGGYVYSFYNGGATPAYYYSFQSSNYTYTLPLQIGLMMSATTKPGVGVVVQMGVQVMGNGTAPAQRVDWFDNATIADPAVQSAYFYVTGNATAPNGTFYDTELVFGGEGNGESTTFTQLSAQLGLFYGNSMTGAQTAFPSYYTFGGNTVEAAYNLQVSYAGNGFSTVSVGTPNYVYLGRVSGAYTLPLAGTKVTTSSFSSQTSTSSQSGSSPGVGSPSYLAYVVAAALAAVIVLLVLVLVMRRGRGGGTIATAPESIHPLSPVSRYCAYCGSPIDPSVKFCPNCGAPQSGDEPGPAEGEQPVQ